MALDSERHTKSINTVIDYINANLDSKLDIETLAKLTSLSVHHFHRIFTAEMGESLSKYIMRKRLELAAIQLCNDRSRQIADIAFEVGFNSANVFCRNFKKHFGMTAETYRSKIHSTDSKNSTFEHKYGTEYRTYMQYFCQHKTINIGGKSMNCDFEIRKMNDIHMVYCRHYGSYTTMQEAFGKLMKWAYPKGLVNTPEMKLAAIYHDNPNVTEESKRISDACLIVSSPMTADGEIGACTLPGGQYATGRFEIPWNEFQQAWECMYRLIDEHGFKCSGLPFEIYLNNPETHPENKWIVDICIPVSAKQ